MLYFASGSSAVGDIRGFARILHPLGVAIPELSERALRELESLATIGVPVFIDTGAFSEVEFGPEGLRVVSPIDDAEWTNRMGISLRLAASLGDRAYAVAPDRVGDQGVTLERLRSNVGALGALRSLGARIVAPIQQGAMAPSEFDRAVADVLGFDDFVRGIPGNKDAMPSHVLENYLRSVRPHAAHVLGVGPKNSRFEEFCAIFSRLIPRARISCDSNLIAANVGRTNGRGGRMRRLTAAAHPGEPGSDRVVFGPDGEPLPMDVSREDAIVLAFGPALFFERAMAAYRERGLAKGGETKSVQMGLFDRVM